MSNHSNCRFVRVRAGVRLSIRILPALSLMSLLSVCASCSSNMGNTSAIGIRGQEAVGQKSQVLPAQAQQQPAAAGAPRIVLDRTTYDFGEIRPQSKNTATFRLTNSGTGVLKISDVQKCCGAVIKLDKKELAVGETGTLTAEYIAGPVPQALSKNIRLLTNDPKNAQVELSVIGKVIQTLTWTPARFEIAAYKEDIVCPPITIKSTDGRPFAIKAFAATGQCLTADFDPNSKASEITLKPKADRAKLEAQPTSTGRIKIDVAHRDYEAIYLDFEIRPVFEVTPQRIFVANAEPGQAVLRTLQLQDRRVSSSANVSGEIESVKFKNGGRVEMRGVTGIGKGCEVNLALWPAADQARGTLWSDQLVIQMKEGRQVTIPVHILFKSQPLSIATNPASNS